MQLRIIGGKAGMLHVQYSTFCLEGDLLTEVTYTLVKHCYNTFHCNMVFELCSNYMYLVHVLSYAKIMYNSLHQTYMYIPILPSLLIVYMYTCSMCCSYVLFIYIILVHR